MGYCFVCCIDLGCGSGIVCFDMLFFCLVDVVKVFGDFGFGGIEYMCLFEDCGCVVDVVVLIFGLFK